MRKLALLTFVLFTACQAVPQAPQSFDDLLKIADTTLNPICTLPLANLRENLSAEALQAASDSAFNYDTIIAKYADDPAMQIQVIFRRAALKRRLNAKGESPEMAQKFYDSFKQDEGTPITLKGFHDDMHYWMDRISEQSEHGAPDTDSFNLRFCVMNERRAKLHAASRKDIMVRVKDGVSLPAPDLVENINHETSFDDGFTAAMLAKIYTKDKVK